MTTDKRIEVEFFVYYYRSYAQCGSSQRSDFVYVLHEQVEARLDKLFT